VQVGDCCVHSLAICQQQSVPAAGLQHSTYDHGPHTSACTGMLRNLDVNTLRSLCKCSSDTISSRLKWCPVCHVVPTAALSTTVLQRPPDKGRLAVFVLCSSPCLEGVACAPASLLDTWYAVRLQQATSATTTYMLDSVVCCTDVHNRCCSYCHQHSMQDCAGYIALHLMCRAMCNTRP
jgi:hypothetical protein